MNSKAAVSSIPLNKWKQELMVVYIKYDSIFGKRVLKYWENRGTPHYSQMNEFREL